jgi:chemotaxis protein MotB
MAGKGGGAWKVAYADFVTAMMAFFLVMWIVAQNKPVKEAIAGYFRDPSGSGLMTGGQGFLEGGAPRSKQGSDSKKKGGAGRIPSLAMLQNQKGLSVGASVTFPENSAALDDQGRERLKDVLPLLIGKKTKIELRAHVIRNTQDDKADPVVAWKMCYDRCLAVMDFLAQQGIDPERFRLSQAGPFEPQVTADDPMWKRRNSRVEIIMLNEYVDEYNANRRKSDDAHGQGSGGDEAHEDEHGHEADDHGKDHHGTKKDDHGHGAAAKDSHAKDGHAPAKGAH